MWVPEAIDIVVYVVARPLHKGKDGRQRPTFGTVLVKSAKTLSFLGRKL